MNLVRQSQTVQSTIYGSETPLQNMSEQKRDKA